MTNASQLKRLVVLAVITIGLTSGVAAQNQYADKGEPEMLYLSDGDKRSLYLVTNDVNVGTGIDQKADIGDFQSQSFQACVYYVQLDPRIWDRAGPWDVDCYNAQEFQSLVNQGYFSDLKLEKVNRDIDF